jgi:hypothetical protein
MSALSFKSDLRPRSGVSRWLADRLAAFAVVAVRRFLAELPGSIIGASDSMVASPSMLLKYVGVLQFSVGTAIVLEGR